MAIGNSPDTFLSLLSQTGYQTSNLYLIQIKPPPLLVKAGGSFPGSDNRNRGNLYSDLIDGMCDEVTIPSKNLNTSEIKTFGTMYRYPTGTSYSEISMSFMVDKYAEIRYYFEAWLGLINSDVSHHVSYYTNLVSPFMTITKYERGIEDFDKGAYKGGLYNYENVETSVYRIYNAYPFNIGSISLSSASSQLVKFQVSFYYERYRLMRSEGYSEAENWRRNRNNFYGPGGAKGPNSEKMRIAEKVTKEQQERWKRENGFPPYNNVNGRNPR